MKTKLLIVCGMLLLSVLFSCQYDEADAKALIGRRVPNYVKIVRVSDGGMTDYIAVDSAYNVYYFGVGSDGSVEQKYPKKKR